MTEALTVLIMLGIVTVGLVLSNWYWLKSFRAAEAEHRKERSELYARLMAKDLTDYTISENRQAPAGRNFVKRGLDESAERLAAQAVRQ